MSNEAVAAARALGPGLIEARSETEEQRCLPEPIIAALVESRLCRVAVPSEQGGLELDPVVALQVYEELAKAEASVAWFAWNNSLPGLFSRFLTDEVRAEIFADPASFYASSTRPTGRAAVESGGYRVSGRWSLVSGCMHANWIAFMCMVEEDGELQMLEPGVPHMRMVFVPKGSYEIVDTWHVGGLRGTGSHDVVVEDLAVPAEKTFSLADPSQIDRTIGRIPIACTMSAGHASICLGIAQSATDAVIALARTKISVDPVPDLRDRPANQLIVAATTAKLDALRAHLQGVLGKLSAMAESGAQWTGEDLADVWSAAIVTALECKSAVTAMYQVAGTTSLYTDCVIERCHRDIHAAMQHVVIQPLWLEEAGRVKFGLDATNPLYAV